MATNRDDPAGDATARRIALDDTGVARVLFGPGHQHLQLLEQVAGIRVTARGTELLLHGDAERTALVGEVLEELYAMAREGRAMVASDVEHAYRVKAADRTVRLRDIFLDTVCVSYRKRPITPQGLGQKAYIDAIRKDDVVFGIGPAGTGKTYLAMAMAVAALKDQEVQRIVITRPAVEAGERLGFLPGDLAQKVNPYLRPLYDALHDMLEYEAVERMLERGTIEVAPLAFMRGRTLNDSFIILDEAQNTTAEQMKMFLTRLGYQSKAVITGDVTQVDLPSGMASGLIEARKILAGISGIAFCLFTERDVVRHPLVQEVIKAYERFEAARAEAQGGSGGGRRNGQR
jgi:phosphate starvation-inducible protein PhoH and related proteins